MLTQRVSPVAGKQVMQLGGSGLSATKLLIAGAASAWLVSPMIGELRYGSMLAKHAGVADRFFGVAAVGEELPFVDSCFDVILSEGCIHHMRTESALWECARVLTKDGRFAAVEPWKAPLYSLGTGVFGKREANSFDTPLTRQRVLPFLNAFESSNVIHMAP